MTCTVMCPKDPAVSPSMRGPWSFLIVCERGRRSSDACACGHSSAFLCDFVVGKRGRTCDQRLCYCCRIHVGEDRDYCLAHATEAHATPYPEHHVDAEAVIGASRAAQPGQLSPKEE